MSRHFRIAVAVLSLAAAGSCASGRTPKPQSSYGAGNTLSADDIAETAATNLYDAIQRLRPQWLTSSRIRRGGSGDDLVVYLDNNRYGSMNSLRQLSVGGVQEVRYFGATEATNRYGTGHTGGAIQVLMSR